MRVIIDGSRADSEVGLVDTLIENGTFTDIGDIKDTPENSEVALLFPETGEEALQLIAEIRNKLPDGLIFVVQDEGNSQQPIDGIHFLTGKQTPEKLMLVMKDYIRKSLTPDLEKISINIELDPDTRQIQVGGIVITLPPSQFSILNLLLSRPGHVFSREEIKAVTNSRAEDLKIVDVWLAKIRNKIQTISGLEIETVREKGFSLKVSDGVLLGGKQIIRIGNLQFDAMRGRLFSDYNEITRLHLTPREIQIMEVLLTSPGKQYSKEFIFSSVYPNIENGEVDMKIVDVFICKIRDRLGIHRDCVETHWGNGYSFNQKAYEKLVIAKRDFEAGITLDDVSDGQDLATLFEKEYDKDWLIYLKVLTPESEVTSLIRVHYDSTRKTANIEVFDSTGFRSIRQAEAFDIIAEQELEKFDDFYAGVRGFMEVRNQDALTGENTWEHILKTLSRSGFWEGRTYRGYCETLDKSVELLKVDGEVHVLVCDKDYYSALTKISLETAGLLFSGKYIKKLSIARPTKNTSRKPRRGAVKIMTVDGIIEQSGRQRTSSRFLDELQAAPTFEERYRIFTTNITPNLTTFFKITSGTMRQKQFVVQLSRVGNSQDVRIKFYDPTSKELYSMTLEEAQKLFGNLNMEPISVQQNIKQIFLRKPKPLFLVPQEQTVQRVEQALQIFSIDQIQEKIETFATEKKTGILLTAFGKIGNLGQFTLTVMNMGNGMEFRIDIFQKTYSSQNYKDFSDVEKYCQSVGCTELSIKS